MRARRLAPSLLISVALAALTLALTARAASLPTLPAPITNACLTVTVQPHVIDAGGVVTARTGPGTGGCTQSQLQWNWFVNGEKSTTCGTSATTCSVPASRPTNGYRPICAVGTGTSPGIQACDYVAVVASTQYTVSGQLTANSALGRDLTDDRPSLGRVAGADVRALDSDGNLVAETTTTASGRYSLSLPRGRYTISIEQDPRPFYHGASTPASRTVVVSGDRRHVNFTIGRIIHLKVHVLGVAFSDAHRVWIIGMHFWENGKLVGGARHIVCTTVVCNGQTRIDGVIGYPWLHLNWSARRNARVGHGVVTSRKVEDTGGGAPNYPSDENQYEGTATVNAGPLFNERGHGPPDLTITLI
jgi:hypothetical protein